MAILNNSNAISAGGYDVNNSLRFRRSASASLTRTPSIAGNRRTFTWSAWVKRGVLDSHQFLLSAATSTAFCAVDLLSNTMRVNFGNGTYLLVTTQVFRDPSAWYHIVLAVDTTQATDANRVKLYINGSQVTSFSTAVYPAQNYDTAYNNTVAQRFAVNDATDYFDGYMAEINLVDGQALTPSSFGETDTTTGVWKPKAYTGTYGTNGFYLKFSDIATTSGSNAGLGKDFSGNTNYWTTNNISVTSGTTYDAMTDSPTLTSATVANYATLNPLMAGTPFQTNAAATVSQGNLQADWGTTSQGSLLSTIAMTSGKWYFEGTVTGTNTREMIGIVNSSAATTTYAGGDANGWGYFSVNGNKYNNGSATSYGATYTTNDIIGVAFDADAGSLTFYKNGTSQGTAFTGLASGTYFFAVSDANSSLACGWNVNFGQRPFTYTPPTGYVALNTYNIPDSTIKKGNSYMDATLYTGNGGTLSVTNAAGFQPDMVWVKSRSNAGTNNLVTDVLRGNKGLFTNLTDADSSTRYCTLLSNGFQFVGTAGDDGNTSGWTYVGWQWKANGAGSSNTSGSITSTVSVNTTAGFSVVTYTGTGANATVGHGLGVAPKMIIVKNRTGTAKDWAIYNSNLGSNKVIWLNLTNASTTDGSPGHWNNTAPTSTVFSLGTDTNVNVNTVNYVAYCFAEISDYSKAFSYTGNGSTDGNFVYLGFRPKFILLKGISTAEDWYIHDSTRNTYNVVDLRLSPNLSSAEVQSTVTVLDFLSNGFKLRTSNGGWNGSGNTYIGIAFAENPFKNSLAR